MSEPHPRYTIEIANMPPGLERYTMRVLEGHIGRKAAIARDELLKRVREMPGCSTASDRQIRAAINTLRKSGQAICSAGGEDGGYWLAEDWAELSEYMERELHSRAMDLLEQEKALKASAEQRWGQYSKQYGLGL